MDPQKFKDLWQLLMCLHGTNQNYVEEYYIDI